MIYCSMLLVSIILSNTRKKSRVAGSGDVKGKSKILSLDTNCENTYLKYHRQIRNLVSEGKDRQSIHFL